MTPPDINPARIRRHGTRNTISMPHTDTKHRRRIIGIALTAALSTALLAQPTWAADTQELGLGTLRTIERQIQLDVVNAGSTPFDLGFASSRDKEKGGVVTSDVDGLKQLPSANAPTTHAPGSTTNYAIHYQGEYGTTIPSAAKGNFLRWYSFDNFFNGILQNTAHTVSTQMLLKSDTGGRIYEDSNAAFQTDTTVTTNGQDGAWAFQLEQVSTPPAGYQQRYRLTIRDTSTAVLPTYEAARNAVTLERITGAAAATPVYRVRVAGHTVSYGELPAAIDAPTYPVEKRTANGTWSEIGTALPTKPPTIDRVNKTVTFPGTEFLWEDANAEGVDALRVGYPFTAVNTWHVKLDPSNRVTVALSSALAPPADLSQSAIKTVGSSESTGQPVVANGVAQETLKLKLTDNNNVVVTPEEQPSLARLYDYIYFRDQNGALVTGIYRAKTVGGYTTVSSSPGAYVNALGMMNAQTVTPHKRYVSTTQGTPIQLIAHLTVTRAQQQPTSSPTLIQRVDAVANASGSGKNGVAISGGITDPNVIAYHHDNGDTATAQILTRYLVRASITSLPSRELFAADLLPQNGGTFALLSTTHGLDDIASLDTVAVSLNGVFVRMNNLPARLAGP